MKIESIYISAFGKFKDYRLNPNSGLNVLYGNNEDGKTTIMSFIKMMFYGNSTKTADLTKNLRKKYAPWDSSTMAGSIEFTHGGVPYRLERTFKSSNKTDTVVLYNRLTDECENYTGDGKIGEKFFSLSEKAFERAVFIGGLGNEESNEEAEGELNNKLSSVAGLDVNQIAAEAVIKRITSAKEALLSKSGKKGKLDLNIMRLNKLGDELVSARETEHNRREMARKNETEQSHLSIALKELDRLNGQLRAAESGKNYKKLKEYISTIELVESLQHKLTAANGSKIDDEVLSKTEQDIKELKRLTSLSPSLKQKLEELREQYNKIDRESRAEAQQKTDAARLRLTELTAAKDETLNKIEQNNRYLVQLERKKSVLQSKKAVNPLFILLFVLFLSLAFVPFIPAVKSALGGTALIAAGGCATVALLFAALTLTLKRKAKLPADFVESYSKAEALSGSLKAELDNALAAINNQNQLISAIKDSAGSNAKLLALHQKEQNENAEQLNENEAKIEQLSLGLAKVLPNFNFKADGDGAEIMLLGIKSNLQKLNSAKAKLAVLANDLGNITKEQAEEDLAALPKDSGDPELIRERLKFKQDECDRLKQDIAYYNAHLATDFKFNIHPTEIEREITTLTKEINEQKAFCEAAAVAEEELLKASSEARQSFGGVLKQRATEIFTSLTGGNYKTLNISKNFDISVEKSDSFGTKESAYLSNGTVDQAYFALRLAVSELLSNDEKLPLMLDDVFCQYDDTRYAAAVEFLRKYSSENQVLFFTCHKNAVNDSEITNIIEKA